MNELIVATKLELATLPLPRVATILKCLVDGFGWAAKGFFEGPAPYPSLQNSGIRFQEHPAHGSGVEWFELPDVTLARGYADCDGLTIYRLGELHAKGIQCESTIADWQGLGGMHAQVRLANGEVEDWSMLLGAHSDWPEDFLYDRQVL